MVARVFDYKTSRPHGRARITVTVKSSDRVCTHPADCEDIGWETDGGYVVRVTYKRRVRVVFTGSPGQAQYRPRTLYFGASGYPPVWRWSSWNGKVARGRGVFPFNDCVP